MKVPLGLEQGAILASEPPTQTELLIKDSPSIKQPTLSSGGHPSPDPVYSQTSCSPSEPAENFSGVKDKNKNIRSEFLVRSQKLTPLASEFSWILF